MEELIAAVLAEKRREEDGATPWLLVTETDGVEKASAVGIIVVDDSKRIAARKTAPPTMCDRNGCWLCRSIIVVFLD